MILNAQLETILKELERVLSENESLLRDLKVNTQQTSLMKF